jgi:hypothetical protein
MSHNSRTLIAGLSAMVGLSIAASPRWQEVDVEPLGILSDTTNATKAPWLKPEAATRFMWGLCRVLKDDHRDFKDGKRWQTFGPSHNEITHWARLNMPATSTQSGGSK